MAEVSGYVFDMSGIKIRQCVLIDSYIHEHWDKMHSVLNGLLKDKKIMSAWKPVDNLEVTFSI